MCSNVRNTAAANITSMNKPHRIHDHPIIDGEGGGFLKLTATAITSTSQVFEC